MKSITTGLILSLRSRLLSSLGSLKSLLCYFWDVFSSPSPSGVDIVALLSLCVSLSSLTGLLLHRWLSVTLRYSPAVSLAASCVHTAALSLASFLLHPVRCLLTITLPTACTQQGRRLLLSASAMLLLLNVVPNVSANVGAVVRILKCGAEGFAAALLNSTEPLNRAKKDLVEEAVKVKREDLSVVRNLRTLDHFTTVDVSKVRSRFVSLIGNVEVHFSQARSLLEELKLASNRLLAAVFVALLVLEAVRYLRSYLTSVRFDNASEEESRTKGRLRLLPGCSLTSRECTSCFFSLVVVTLYFTAVALVVALDYVVFYVVQMVVPWLQDFPPTSAVISVDYRLRWFPPASCLIPSSCITRELAGFQKGYRWSFRPEASLCRVETSPPSGGVCFLLAALCLLSYLLVFLELYARRLRRKISASFFREQEERRRVFLRRRTAEKQKQGNKTGSVGV